MDYAKPFFYSLLTFFSLDISKASHERHELYRFMAKLHTFKKEKRKVRGYDKRTIRSYSPENTKNQTIIAGCTFLENYYDFIQKKDFNNFTKVHNKQFLDNVNKFSNSINILKGNNDKNFNIFLKFINDCPNLVFDMHTMKYKTHHSNSDKEKFEKSFFFKEHSMSFYKKLYEETPRYWADISHYINSLEEPKVEEIDEIYKRKMIIRAISHANRSTMEDDSSKEKIEWSRDFTDNNNTMNNKSFKSHPSCFSPRGQSGPLKIQFQSRHRDDGDRAFATKTSQPHLPIIVEENYFGHNAVKKNIHRQKGYFSPQCKNMDFKKIKTTSHHNESSFKASFLSQNQEQKPTMDLRRNGKISLLPLSIEENAKKLKPLNRNNFLSPAPKTKENLGINNPVENLRRGARVSSPVFGRHNNLSYNLPSTKNTIQNIFLRKTVIKRDKETLGTSYNIQQTNYLPGERSTFSKNFTAIIRK